MRSTYVLSDGNEIDVPMDARPAIESGAKWISIHDGQQTTMLNTAHIVRVEISHDVPAT